MYCLTVLQCMGSIGVGQRTVLQGRGSVGLCSAVYCGVGWLSVLYCEVGRCRVGR